MVENIVANLCAKFNDDRLWNEKVLVLWKCDKNNNPKDKNNNQNNVRSHWGKILRTTEQGLNPEAAMYTARRDKLRTW